MAITVHQLEGRRSRTVRVTNPGQGPFRDAGHRSATSSTTTSRSATGSSVRSTSGRHSSAASPEGSGRADLPEARSAEAPRVDRGRARHVPVGPARGRALRDRAGTGDLGGQTSPSSTSIRGLRLVPTSTGRTSCESTSTRARHDFADGKRVAAVVREVIAEIGYTAGRRRRAPVASTSRCESSRGGSSPVVRRCALAFARGIGRARPTS